MSLGALHFVPEARWRIFGERFDFIQHRTADLCGEAHFAWNETASVNVVDYYERVSAYLRSDDSVVGKSFVSLLIMLLIIWTMVMLQEARTTMEFFTVVWATPSTTDDDPDFASVAQDGKMKVEKLPRSHKAYILILIVFSQLVLAVYVYIVGARFLSMTDSLIDLIQVAYAIPPTPRRSESV